MYNNDQIQAILNSVRNDDDFLKKFEEQYKKSYGRTGMDYFSILHVIREGWYEEFDRYDSDVREQFLYVYEKVV